MKRGLTSAGIAVFAGLCVAVAVQILFIWLVFPNVYRNPALLSAAYGVAPVLGGVVTGWLYGNCNSLYGRIGFLIGSVSGVAIAAFAIIIGIAFWDSVPTQYALADYARRWLTPGAGLIVGGGVGGIIGSALRGASSRLNSVSDPTAQEQPNLKGIVRTLGVVVSIFLAVSSYIWYSVRPVIPDQMWDLRIGMTSQDVSRLKGDPHVITDLGEWQYFQKDVVEIVYTVSFMKEKVVQIGVSSKKQLCPRLWRVSCGYSKEAFERLLGPPTNTVTSNDGAKRMLIYENFRAFFVLSRRFPEYETSEGAESMAIYDPINVTPGFAR